MEISDEQLEAHAGEGRQGWKKTAGVKDRSEEKRTNWTGKTG